MLATKHSLRSAAYTGAKTASCVSHRTLHSVQGRRMPTQQDMASAGWHDCRRSKASKHKCSSSG